MDVIYHRNCLDGVFSSHLFYMITKVITNDKVDAFVMNMLKRVETKKEFESLEKTKEYEEIIDLTQDTLDKS